MHFQRKEQAEEYSLSLLSMARVLHVVCTDCTSFLFFSHSLRARTSSPETCTHGLVVAQRHGNNNCAQLAAHRGGHRPVLYASVFTSRGVDVSWPSSKVSSGILGKNKFAKCRSLDCCLLQYSSGNAFLLIGDRCATVTIIDEPFPAVEGPAKVF